MRVFGPSLGFWFSSLCLNYYEDPLVEPDFGMKDPQWIGAWWIGFLVLGFVLFLTSFPLLCFPRYIQEQPVTEAPVARNLKESLCSQISFWASAPVVLFSGFIISRFKPRPRLLTGYMMFVQLFAGVVMIAALFIYCQTNVTSETDSFLFHEVKDCNLPCSCNMTNFSPVCDIHGVSHFSACSAGCRTAYKSDKFMVFGNCSCIGGSNTGEVQATKGICTVLCNKVWPYIIIIIITNIMASSARVGDILITLRCVDKADKTLALGAVECLISIFATIPNPILYGYLFDKSCLLWGESCGVQGNCLFYDSTLLRYYLHSASISFILLGACSDFIVFMLSSRLKNFYDEPVPVEQHNQELGESEDL